MFFVRCCSVLINVGGTMNQEFSTLSIHKHSACVWQVSLNRPEVCNAINSVMMKELLVLWTQLNEQPDLRAVVLTGEGEKAFCAGADLKERLDLDVITWQAQHAVLQDAMRAMMACQFPIIGAINGAAFGGGLELTMACDFAYAADNAIFSQSEVKLGIMPGAMGTQNLPRAVGTRKAKELTMTGERFSAAQALEWGLLNRVTSRDDLLPQAIATAESIAENAPIAVRQAKKAINFATSANLMEGYGIEVSCYNSLLATQDRKEGIRAFNEKRKPTFIGE